MIRGLTLLVLSAVAAGCSEETAANKAPGVTQDATTGDAQESGTVAANPNTGQDVAEAGPADVPQGDAAAEGATDSGQNPLFDVPAIEDVSTAQCSFTDNSVGFVDGVLLQRFKVT